MSTLRILILISLVVGICPSFPYCQDSIHEQVGVTNIEVPVRVFRDGALVGGLGRDQFRLFEDGHEIAINGFREVHRSIAGTSVSAPQSAPRLFVLYFWLYEREVDYKGALDEFFIRLYRPGDVVLLVSQNRTYAIRSAEEIPARRKELDDDILATCERMETNRRFQYLEGRRRPSDLATLSKSAWSEFDTLYSVDEGKLLNFASSLKKLNQEKWVLVFYQREVSLFTDLGRVGGPPGASSEMARRFLDFMIAECQRRRGRERYDLRQLQEHFADCGAALFMVLLDSKWLGSSIDEERMQRFETAHIGLQETLTRISHSTGGQTVEHIEPRTALAQLANWQDCQYVLSYEPRQGVAATRSIEIRLDDASCSLVYNTEFQWHGTENVYFSSVEWVPPNLVLVVKNYSMELLNDGVRGRLQLSIHGIAPHGQKMEFSRLFLPDAPATEMALKLNLAELGRYRMLVEVLDLIGGFRAAVEKTITINRN